MPWCCQGCRIRRVASPGRPVLRWGHKFSRQLIVLELFLVLGTISQAASAATRVHQRQILTTPTPTIEFEDEDEFEDDFWIWFLLGRGCPRLGQPIEKPISPGPPGRGSFAGAEAEVPAYFSSASPRREHRWSDREWIS